MAKVELVEAQAEADNIERKRRASTAFPKRSLMDALRLAESIKTNNNLRPYNRLDLASSIGFSPNSSSYRMLITNSNGYGLTTGGYQAEKISLTSLGISIVSPKSEEEKNQALKKALFNIPLFQKFFTSFNQGSVPRKDLLINTLHRDYDIPVEDCEACYEIIIKNAKELGILANIKGTEYIKLDNLSPVESLISKAAEKEQPTETVEAQDFTVEAESEKPLFKPKVFISHSKNKKVLEQIKTILKFGQFDYVVAEERETTAIPIAEKVFGLMKDCNCAIINLSVDEQEEKDGNYNLNPNVLIEIGAAFLQYNKKVILLVDKRLSAKIPSNLNGLYRSEYQGDELSFDTAMKLQEALANFRIGN